MYCGVLYSMIFSNSTTKAGLVEECDFLVGSNSVTYPIEQKTRNANRALDKVVSLILSSDGRWQFDDTNYTDLPIGTTNLVLNQQDYSFSTDMITVTRVEIKDADGNWHYLNPFDQRDLTPSEPSPIPSGYASPINTGYSLTDFLNTPGTPAYYDKLATSVFLYPEPSYNSTNGLKVYFQRQPSYFATTDTTKEPGFAKHLHRYISLSMAYDYALAKNLAKLNTIRNEMLAMEKAIVEFYNIRKKDEKPVMVARVTPSY